MEILLIAAIAVVAVAALYVAATFDLRARQSTAPLIEEAVRKISDQLRATEESMRRQLQALADDLQRDREQQRLDGRKIQGRLDHADSRIASVANQFLADLDAIKRRTDQTGAQQDQFTAGLRQLGQRVARLSEALGHPAGPAADPGSAGPAPAVPGPLYAERIRFSLARQAPAEAGVRIQVERSVAELPARPAPVTWVTHQPLPTARKMTRASGTGWVKPPPAMSPPNGGILPSRRLPTGG